MEYSFSPGDIIYLHEVDYTDHPKYHLVLSIKEDFFFVINTEINSFIRSREDLLKCQIEYKVIEGETFPNHDCYIACHEIADSIFSQAVEKALQEDKGKNYGKINKNVLKKVINILHSNLPKTFTPIERRTVISNLSEVLKEIESK